MVIEFAIGQITALDRELARFADLPDEAAAGANFGVGEDRVIQISWLARIADKVVIDAEVFRIGCRPPRRA